METTATKERRILTPGREQKLGIDTRSYFGRNGAGYVECTSCGEKWWPMIKPGGRFARGWYKCPHGCNHDKTLKS